MRGHRVGAIIAAMAFAEAMKTQTVAREPTEQELQDMVHRRRVEAMEAGAATYREKMKPLEGFGERQRARAAARAEAKAARRDVLREYAERNRYTRERK